MGGKPKTRTCECGRVFTRTTLKCRSCTAGRTSGPRDLEAIRGRVLDLYRQGKTYSQITALTGAARSTIARYARDELYGRPRGMRPLPSDLLPDDGITDWVAIGRSLEGEKITLRKSEYGRLSALQGMPPEKAQAYVTQQFIAQYAEAA